MKTRVVCLAVLVSLFSEAGRLAYAQQPPVQAWDGSISAGRDANNNIINQGLDEKALGPVLTEALRPMVEQLAREKGVEAASLRAVLTKLGEVGVVPDAEIPARLNSAADQLIELRAQLSRPKNNRPELAPIREQALALINRGDLDGARAVLNQGREVARAQREEASRSEAELLADEAMIDHLLFAYDRAAAKYGEAAALVRSFDAHSEWSFLTEQVIELIAQGNEFGNDQALNDAIMIAQRAFALVPRDERPLDWAKTQNNLGLAFTGLGARESGTGRLKAAVAAYENALQEITRERMPLEWATAQNNLGNVLQALGGRESGTGLLKAAVAAYENALQVRTKVRERVPLEWATTQNNLGNALRSLGERESGTGLLVEAVAAYENALQERTRERSPIAWAKTQHNLGNALQTLGGRESGTGLLVEAVAAYENALQEITRERMPLYWAASTGNQGVALILLAERRKDAGMAEMAVGQIEEAHAMLRDNGHASAAYYGAQLQKARTLHNSLKTR